MKEYHKIWNDKEWTITCEDNMELSFDEDGNITGIEVTTVEPSDSCDFSIGFHSNL